MSIFDVDRAGTDALILRRPYVGQGVDGARRSARVDHEEADTLPAGEDRDRCLLSAERWGRQAEHLERGAGEGS